MFFVFLAPGLGCCPAIVTGPKGSIIQPFTGWRGNVALIVDWGTCTVKNQGFKSVAGMMYIHTMHFKLVTDAASTGAMDPRLTAKYLKILDHAR